MNNKRYQEIIDEVYENYLGGGDIKWLKPREYDTPMGKINVPTLYSKEELIDKCKTDSEFSEKWGLKIEERELTWEEQVHWVMKNTDVEWENVYIVEEIAKETTPKNLLTVTYKDEKIEVYESL